jgi:hypothetical protein
MHRTRLHELGRVAEPLPRLGLMVWVLHPFAALRRVSQITASRLNSVPLNVMDWMVAPSAESAGSNTPVDVQHRVVTDAPSSESEAASTSIDVPASAAIGTPVTQPAEARPDAGAVSPRRLPRLGGTSWD